MGDSDLLDYLRRLSTSPADDGIGRLEGCNRWFCVCTRGSRGITWDLTCETVLDWSLVSPEKSAIIAGEGISTSWQKQQL
jgi:hypothetical protein